MSALPGYGKCSSHEYSKCSLGESDSAAPCFLQTASEWRGSFLLEILKLRIVFSTVKIGSADFEVTITASLH